jgi:hypothetical protein
LPQELHFEAIKAGNPFSALPKEFLGVFLQLRFKFQYNPEKGPAEPAQPK